MLKFLCRQATFILMFSIGNRALQIDPEYYVPFFSHVQEYYKSSGIFILYDDNSERFATRNNIAVFFKRFSARGIMSQALLYSQLKENSDYLSMNTQALFIVFLTSRSNLNNFCSLTEEHDMSYQTWLIVFAEYISDEINEMCKNPKGNPFHLVFNTRMIVVCHNDQVVKKWYSLHSDRTEVIELANWNLSLGISYRSKNYYESRYDLSGKFIRIATNTKAMYAMNGKMSGFFEDILQELKNFMNFSVQRAREADAYGKLDAKTRKWSGLMGFLTTREVDIAVAPITMSKLRLSFVDFTRPLLLSANRIYIRQPSGARVQWSAYFRAFTLASWSSIAFVLLLASLMTTFIRATLKDFKFFKLSGNYVLDNFVRIWGIYCQQGVPEFPSAIPLRLAYFTMLLLTVVIWAIYSASITSYLAILTPGLPFSDTEGFVKDGSYQLIVLQNSSDQDLILSGTDPILTALQPFLKELDYLPTNPYDGFQQVCNERVGFYTSEDILKGVSAYIPCTLTSIATGQYECLAMALTKRSPYITSINYNLRKLEDNGVMKKLRNWYFRKMNVVVESGHSPIGLWGVAPLLAIFASGFGLSILVLFLEHLHRSAKRNRENFY